MNSVKKQFDDVQGITEEMVMPLIPEQAQIMTSYRANEGLIRITTDVLGMQTGASLNWDPTSITLPQIKKRIEDLQKDLDIIDDADFQAIFNFIAFSRRKRAS